MARLSMDAGNGRAPLNERRDDLYETPSVAVRALLSVERLPSIIWEPACGPGNIVRELRSTGRTVIATDLVNYGCPEQLWGVDFLMERRPLADCIVTNPPFKNAAEFVAKALQLCPRVVMLLRLAFLESERRRDILDNGNLARVHVFRKRLPMMHRAGWGGRKANSGMAFAWFVWDRRHNGPASLSRLSWEPFAHNQQPEENNAGISKLTCQPSGFTGRGEKDGPLGPDAAKEETRRGGTIAGSQLSGA